MQRMFLAALTLAAAAPACAQWERFAQIAGDTAVVYIAPAAARWSGEPGNRAVEVWEMIDYGTAQESGQYRFLSRKQKTEYSCKTRRSRQRFLTLFSERMGSGQIVHSSSAGTDRGEWKSVVPGSPRESIWKHFCGQKSRRNLRGNGANG